jgi:hypothetical protein
MKHIKTIVTIGFILLSFNSIGQLKNFPILLCQDDTMVIKVLDSLNTAAGGKYTVTTRTPDPQHIVLTETFAMEDQAFYSCYDLILKFIKLGPFYICIREDVLTTSDYAAPNIDYVKANFTTKLSDSKWEMQGPTQFPILFNATVEWPTTHICHIVYDVKDLDR